MIRYTGVPRTVIPLVALNHSIIFSQCIQDLGHTFPARLTDANGSRYSLRNPLMGLLGLYILSSEVRHLSHQGFDARFIVHHTPGTVTGVLHVSPPPYLSWDPRMSK